jgi:hypothetical protein
MEAQTDDAPKPGEQPPSLEQVQLEAANLDLKLKKTANPK